MRVARVVLLVLAVLVLAQVVLVKPYRVPSVSMVSTFLPGDRVLAGVFWYRLTDPKRGDIVVFHPNGDGAFVFRTDRASTRTFVKRVVALPGETAGSVRGRMYVCREGVRPATPAAPEDTAGCAFLTEDYTHGLPTTQCEGPQAFGPETVPDDQYLLLGDNRVDSQDSRCFGTIPRSRILGRVLARYWPLDRVGAP